MAKTNLTNSKTYNFVVKLSPFCNDRLFFNPEAGTSIYSALLKYTPNASHAVISINGASVNNLLLDKIMPKSGTTVHAYLYPLGGGDGKNPIATILTLAVIFAAPYVGGYLATGTWVAASTFAGTTGLLATAYSVGFSMLGMMAISALIPPSSSARDSANTNNNTYQISASSNEFRPFGYIPRVFGKTRIYPVHAAHPWTESVGNDRYIRMLLLCGYGPLKISDIRLGETSILAFDGVETEITEGGADGWAGNKNLTLYTQSIAEESLYVDLLYDASQIRTTDVDVNAISIDITFARGLFSFDNKGATAAASVSFYIEYKLTSESSYTTYNANLSYTESSTSAVIKSVYFTVQKGKYDVRIRRITQNTNNKIVDTATWTAIRSYKNSAPVTKKQVCLIAIRIKATAQLNGVPNTINCLAESYLPVYKSSSSSWVYELTRNPAWQVADLLRRRGDQVMLSDNMLDIPAFLNCASYCDNASSNGGTTAEQWTYDGSINGGSVGEAISKILAHGKSVISFRDGKYSIVTDTKNTVPAQCITPANSWGYSGSKKFINIPHGIIVKFRNKDKNYQEDEITVYADGYTKTTASKFESVDYPGYDNHKKAWSIGRYLLAAGKLRPEEHTLSMDIEALRCSHGDTVFFAHDVIAVGAGFGRIKSVDISNGYASSIKIDGTIIIPEQSTNVSIVVRKINGDVITLSITNSRVNAPYETADISFASVAVSSAPQEGDLYMYGESTRVTLPMIIKKIEPSDNLTARITMVDAAWDLINYETGATPDYDAGINTIMPISQLKPSTPVISLRSDETVLLVSQDGSLTCQIAIDIAPQKSGLFIDSYNVEYKKTSGTYWQKLDISTDLSTVYISDAEESQLYDIRVRSISSYGVPSNWATITNYKVIGKTNKPPVCDIFEMSVADNGSQLLSWAWDASKKPIDLKGYMIRVRQGAGWSWGDMYPIDTDDGVITVSPYTIRQQLSGTYTFAIKTRDTGDRLSETATYLQANLSSRYDDDAYISVNCKSLSWPGEKTDLYIEDGDLVAADIQKWSTTTTWDDTIAWRGASVRSATYTHTVIDLSASISYFLSVKTIADGVVTIEERHGDTSSPDASWSSWSESVASQRSRYVQVRATIKSSSSANIIALHNLTISLIANTIFEQVNDCIPTSLTGSNRIGVGDVRVPIKRNYSVITTVLPVIQSISSGTWTVSIIDKSPSAPRLQFRNAGTLADPPSFDCYIRGAK